VRIAHGLGWLAVASLLTARLCIADNPREAAREPGALRSVIALAQQGDTQAQYMLGLDLMRGNKVDRDLVRGYTWIEIAAQCTTFCTATDAADAAKEARVRVGRFLTGKQLVEAEQAAADYWQLRRSGRDPGMEAARAALKAGTDAPDMLQRAGCAQTRDPETCKNVIPDGMATHCSGIKQDPDSPPSAFGPLARTSRPHYSLDVAMHSRSTGKITFVAHIDDTGYVCKGVIVRGSGDDAIDNETLAQVIKWRLQPATSAGAPVEAIHIFNFKYTGAALQW
jgi:hypothetical protein